MDKVINAIELGMYLVGYLGRSYHPNKELREDLSDKILIEECLNRIGLINIKIPVCERSLVKEFIEEIRLRLNLKDLLLNKAYNFGTVVAVAYDCIEQYKFELIELGTKIGLEKEWLSSYFNKIQNTETSQRPIIILEEILKLKNNNNSDGVLMNEEYDFFISHASEDKEGIVRNLVNLLIENRFKVWYDEFELIVGDGLRKKIDYGLTKSKFGIVIISQYFISKKWTEFELDGLVTREMNGHKVILPIWHNITLNEVIEYSPSLANKLALDTSKHTLEEIVAELKKLFKKPDPQHGIC